MHLTVPQSQEPPNVVLARRVAAALAAEGLIEASTIDALALRLAEGTVRAAEWEGVVVDPPAVSNDPGDG